MVTQSGLDRHLRDTLDGMSTDDLLHVLTAARNLYEMDDEIGDERMRHHDAEGHERLGRLTALVPVFWLMDKP
jgi:hypothetical protein